MVSAREGGIVIPQSLRPPRARAWLAAGVLLALLIVAGALPGSGSSAGSTAPTFATPVYVDQQLAGGEPEVFADALHGRLIYSAHEGTTHLYRDGLTMSPWGDFAFVSNYCNQVNTWTSPDGGVNWYRDRYLGSTCPQNPTYTGFSDPDLTQDAGGRVYNTGINLVNDAVFSSQDGGQTWDKGTGYCHDGDRPWLAGGAARQTRCSWAPTPSRAAAAATRCSCPPTAATPAAPTASTTTGPSPTAARG